jgi:hypothetical protein
MRISVLLFMIFLLSTPPSFADLVNKLDDLVGYTIIAKKTIKGWYDDDESEENAFKGCSHGRVIVFTDNRILTCAEYGYQYAYRPTAIILSNGSRYKMIVGNNVYDMSR